MYNPEEGFEQEQEEMQASINRLLKKEPYTPVRAQTRDCNHSPDGHIYDEEPNPIETTVRCKLCGEFYTVPSSHVNFDLLYKNDSFRL